MDNGGYYGALALGDTLHATVLAKNNNDTPTDVTGSATYKVYNGTTQIGGTHTASKVGSNTGFYSHDLVVSSGNGFVEGEIYTAVWSYTVSAVSKGARFTFQVI